MRLCILITLLLSFVQLTTFSQSLRAYERAGDDAFDKKDYAAAVQYYGDVLKRHEQDYSLWWKYAESARLYNAFTEAERSYKKIIDSKKHKNQHPLAEYRLAEVKKSQGDYPTAIAYFEKFLAKKPKIGAQYLEKAKLEIDACLQAQVIAAAPILVEMKHLGKEINSPWYEFAPSIVGDSLFYSSYRFDKRTDKGKNKRKLSKVMIAVNGGRGREPGRGFPATDTAHIAHTAFSPDGHYVFFSVCKDLNVNDKRCELWMTVIDRRKRWLPPVKLPEPINKPGYTTTQPNIAYDNEAEGPVLWFSSDRPGGKGKLDLWRVPLDTNFFCECNLPLPGKKVGRLPRFADPENVTALNTPENEVSPFFYSPEQKLYFSSDGLPGLGGFDIFHTLKEDGGFASPQNAGPGLNTSYNDMYFILKNDGSSGYLSSNRPGALYLDERNKACCNDLFAFSLLKPEVKPIPKEPEEDSIDLPLLALKSPNTAPTQPIAALPVEPKLSDFTGLPLYFDNDEPDKRSRKTATQSTYLETVEAYLARQQEYRDRFSANLKATQADTAEQIIDAFFENEVRNGAERFNLLCDLMFDRLQKGAELEMIIKGYTSPRAKSDYNEKLAQRRISSVRNQLEAFSDGSLKSYLQDGKLKIRELSFGETTAKGNISDNLSDERNSIYHPNAARERRVEIVEVLIR
jgi:outer membrane protein OmpA-like peptidoglycan-associated protein